MRDHEGYLWYEDDAHWFCADKWCDGHALPSQRCIDPLLQDDEDEEMCP